MADLLAWFAGTRFGGRTVWRCFSKGIGGESARTVAVVRIRRPGSALTLRALRTVDRRPGRFVLSRTQPSEFDSPLDQQTGRESVPNHCRQTMSNATSWHLRTPGWMRFAARTTLISRSCAKRITAPPTRWGGIDYDGADEPVASSAPRPRTGKTGPFLSPVYTSRPGHEDTKSRRERTSWKVFAL